MLTPDSEIRSNLVKQTAELRFSIASRGLRGLLLQRGHDPMKCVQMACDQGDDVSIDLMLEDTTTIRLNYREHFQTRQAIRIVDWEPQTKSDCELEIAKRMVSQNDETFDDDVSLYFDQYMAKTDSLLPPLKWGDHLWHAFEQAPD